MQIDILRDVIDDNEKSIRCAVLKAAKCTIVGRGSRRDGIVRRSLVDGPMPIARIKRRDRRATIPSDKHVGRWIPDEPRRIAVLNSLIAGAGKIGHNPSS